MREPKRIPIALSRFQNREVLKDFLQVPNRKILDKIHRSRYEIQKTWKDNPDLRFGQLLCVMRLIPNLDIENRIWHIEEMDWLKKKNYLKEMNE